MARPSHVRSAIAEIVSGSERHDWTIESVADTLAKQGVAADRSSVFRGLTRLAEDGQIERVELGDGKTRWEAPREHHEHMVCGECGAVAAYSGCLVGEATREIERATGFRVTGHRLLLSGLCARCATAAAS